MLRWEADITATASISHGGEPLGTVTYLRRERILTPTGELLDIPIISGNTVRGRLRDTAATLWWRDADQPPLTTAVAHAIFSGGALTKHTGEPLSGERLRTLKTLCPPIELFGAAGGGRIIDGAIQVGKLIPISQQTSHLLNLPNPDQQQLPDLWDLTQLEWYSRRPTTVLPDGTPTPEPTPPLARYGIETFLPGTRFHWWLTADRLTDTAAALLHDTITTYTTTGRLGGATRIGHGTFTTHWHTQPTKPTHDWRRNGTQLALDELEILAWLD